MRRVRQSMLLAALLVGLAVLFAAPTPAAADVTSGDSLSTVCADYPGLTNRIAGCIREAVDTVAQRFFDADTGFYSLVSMFIGAFMSIGVAIYGIMVATGMVEKAGRDTLMFLVKMSMVAYFTLNSPLMYDYVVDAMDGMGSLVVRVTPANGWGDGSATFSSMTCYRAMTDSGNAAVGPWVAMDCLIDTVFGIRTDSINGTSLAGGSSDWYNKQLEGKGLQRGMIHFFFSGMQTSVLGLMLGILGFIFMWGLIAMIIKALFTYIAGYLGITFMMIISPLFIPMVLFQTTKQYFDKWVKLTISFALQPVIIMLFISFAIAAVDLALYSGDYSVMYRIAGNESRKSGFSLNKYLTDNGAITPKAMEAGFIKIGEYVDGGKFTMPTGKSILEKVQDECTLSMVRSGSTSNPACAQNMAIKAYRDTVDWKRLAEIRKPAVTPEDGATSAEQQIAREVMASVIFCGIIIFIMNRLMAVVPHMIVDLVGDYGQTPNLQGLATGEWSNAAGAIGQKAGVGVKESGSKAADVVSGGIKDALSGLIGRRKAGE